MRCQMCIVDARCVLWMPDVYDARFCVAGCQMCIVAPFLCQMP